MAGQDPRPPLWAMYAMRSLSLPAGAMLRELFMQGTRVRQAKASGGGEFVVWNRPLEELRACSTSMVHRAKVELISRGFLFEQPGARVASNGRLFSSWSAPVADPEYTSISSDSPEYPSKSSGSPSITDSSVKAEYHSISSDSLRKPSRTRVRGLEPPPPAERSDTTTTTNHLPVPGTQHPVPGEGEGEMGPVLPDVPNQQEASAAAAAFDSEEAWRVAHDGLRAARVSNPSQVLADFRWTVNHVLAALEYWVAKEQRGERVDKPGGLVMSWLLSHALPWSAPAVVDLSFQRHWGGGSWPEKVIEFRRAK